MTNIIVGLIIAAILGAAVAYIVREKKKGAKCIGCPASDCCSMKKANHPQTVQHAGGGCGCHMGK